MTAAEIPSNELRVSFLNPGIRFGAVVERPISAAALLQDASLIDSLVTSWRDCGGLLVMRGMTDMTASMLEAVSSRFGVLEVELDDSKRKYQVDGVSSVMRLGNTRDAAGALTAVLAKDAPLPTDDCCQYVEAERRPVWHTDQTYRKSPPIGSLLFCKQAPPSGAATCFADMRSAYEELDVPTQRRLLGLECVCSLTHHDAKVNKYSPDYPVPTSDQRAANPPVRVPMVLRHPLTQRLSLYGMNASTCQILSKGTSVSQDRMDVYELEALEDVSVQQEWRSLLPRVTSSRYTVVWKWQPGDLVIWDNRCTIHCATGFEDQKYTREMWRTTLAADLANARL